MSGRIWIGWLVITACVWGGPRSALAQVETVEDPFRDDLLESEDLLESDNLLDLGQDDLETNELPAPEDVPRIDPDLNPADDDFPTTSDADMEPPLDSAEFDRQTADAEVLPNETIRERYPDGAIKIERGVTQDENENFINHGPWRMYGPDGELVAEGEYRFGKRHGKWSRLLNADDTQLLELSPYNLFTGPFLSSAEFQDGRLHGFWTIRDHTDQIVSRWEFSDGRRDGESIWNYHTGRPMRRIAYRQGRLDGPLTEWNIDGEIVTEVSYENGRRLEEISEEYEDGKKKTAGEVLRAELVLKEPDDWWESKLTSYVTKGKDQKHGEWSAWYPSGQLKFRGAYKWDKPAGKFTWWHPNGQQALEAFYVDGEKQGQWTWWHENGMKSIQGSYFQNQPIDRWVWWHANGKVARRVGYGNGGFPNAAGKNATPIPSQSSARR